MTDNERLIERSLKTLELPAVLNALSEQAISQNAKQMCLNLRPYTVLSECERLQQQTAESMLLIGTRGSPSFGDLKDISAPLERADKGGLLNFSELLLIAGVLRTAAGVKSYRQGQTEQSELQIDQFFSMISGNKYLEEKISNAIVSEEEMSDHASAELYRIRRQIRVAQSKIRDVLAKIISSQNNSKMLQDAIITQRSGRFVVPVKSEYRGAFAGLVHDTSSSGATLFVEPSAVVELNNNIRVLGGKEQDEIERILAELSAEVANFGAAIARDFELLCELDFIFARGKLGYAQNATRPILKNSGTTELKKARHPLIPKEQIVPVSFSIGGAIDTVIITGPNTGGKTVSIKTLGLMTVMAQCGLHIPAQDDSTVVIKSAVLADIGDEQSIEQSLSTFSSHMTNIVSILKVADSSTMVLLDELGAGTDPVEGAALAQAIIEEFRGKGSTVAATTHYAELKVYALETEGIENASCEFDVATLMPTYKLIFGIPGKSNAFAISERLGLPLHIVEAAGERMDNSSKEFEQVITKLEERRQQLEASAAQAEIKLRDATQLSQKAKERLDNLESEREKLLEKAKTQAQEIISNARAASDMVLTEARRIKQQAEEGKDLNLSAARSAFRENLSAAEKHAGQDSGKRMPEPLPRPLKAGDTVEIVATRTKATVLETPSGNSPVKLQAGILKITVKQSEIELVPDILLKPEKSTPKPASSRPAAPQNVSPNLDIRGQNGDDAVMELDRFIDNAIRVHLETITIIHGKGTGVLRHRVHEHLKRHPMVKSYRLGVYGEGEAGVTVATLKG